MAVSVIKTFRSMHVLPYVCYSWQWVSSTIIQIKTNFLTGQWNIYYFTQDLTYLLYFQGKLALFIGEFPGNIHFLPLFHWFWEWVRCLILQINTSFLISQQRTYIFTQETLHISFTYLNILVFRTQSNI